MAHPVAQDQIPAFLYGNYAEKTVKSPFLPSAGCSHKAGAGRGAYEPDLAQPWLNASPLNPILPAADIIGMLAHPAGDHKISHSDLAVVLQAIPSTGKSPQSQGMFRNAWLHRLVGHNRMVRSVLMGLHAQLELAIMAGHKRPAWLDCIRAVRSKRESLLSGNEAFMLYSLARSQSGLATGGEMAEVGVYQGCSARMISLGSGGIPLHLFDTFNGLPAPMELEQARLSKGQYAARLESVQAFMADRPNISFHAGVFPDTAAGVGDRKFSLVHLDVDLKVSTLESLKFFYPRMVRGGVIITHDYSYLDGVREAFDEFLATKDERLIELPMSQAMLVKL